MNVTVCNAHLEQRDQIEVRRYQPMPEHIFLTEPYSVLTIGNLSIFPSSLDQLREIASAIHKHLISLEPDEPVARVIANHLMDEAKKIIGEPTFPPGSTYNPEEEVAQ